MINLLRYLLGFARGLYYFDDWGHFCFIAVRISMVGDDSIIRGYYNISLSRWSFLFFRYVWLSTRKIKVNNWRHLPLSSHFFQYFLLRLSKRRSPTARAIIVEIVWQIIILVNLKVYRIYITVILCYFLRILRIILLVEHLRQSSGVHKTFGHRPFIEEFLPKILALVTRGIPLLQAHRST